MQYLNKINYYNWDKMIKHHHVIQNKFVYGQDFFFYYCRKEGWWDSWDDKKYFGTSKDPRSL